MYVILYKIGRNYSLKKNRNGHRHCYLLFVVSTSPWQADHPELHLIKKRQIQVLHTRQD